jgi:hypothetical protein
MRQCGAGTAQMAVGRPIRVMRLAPLLPSAACALFLLACARPPHLTSDVATRRATTAAVKYGYVLRDYKLPVVHPPEHANGKWVLQFDALDGKPGPQFLVLVDDRTGDTQVTPGK